MYKLYTDKQEVFKAQIELEGVNINESSARLILENENLNLIFKGNVSSNGDIKIPIHKLKNILKEGDKGKLKLEVIAEDVYFNPWEDNFEVDTFKKLTVEIQPQIEEELIEENIKPTITIKKVTNDTVPSTSLNEENEPTAENYINEYISIMSNKDIFSQNDFNLLTETFINKKQMNSDTQKEFYTLLKKLL